MKEDADPVNLFKEPMNVYILSTKMANNRITDSKTCSRVFIAVPKKYLSILQEVQKEHKGYLTIYHIE